MTPSGWGCEHLPYLVELDNWGASRQPGKAGAGGIWVWGYDEITLVPRTRARSTGPKWLRYAWDWVRKTDPNGHLQMPGSRTIRSPLDGKRWYYANKPSRGGPDRARGRGRDPGRLGERWGRKVASQRGYRLGDRW